MANATNSTKSSETTTNVYNKDVVQMQVDDLLKELSILRKRSLEAAKAVLHQLKASIESLQDIRSVSAEVGKQLLWRVSKTAIPFPGSGPNKDVKYTFAYSKPVKIDLVGSFAIDTAFVRKYETPSIDLALTIPASILQSKDYLDHRYFYKRAFYLACVASGLTKCKDLGLEFSYSFLNDSPLQPIIVAVPKGDLNYKFNIRILLTVDSDVFPIDKTLPYQNCIRNGIEHEHMRTATESPVYNGSLRADCSIQAYSEFLKACAKQAPGFTPACTLLSVWLSRRGLGTGISQGGFGPFEVSALVAILLTSGGANGRPTLSRGYNGLQLAKAVLQFLHSRDLVKEPFQLGQGNTQAELLKNRRTPMLWDATRGLNVLYKMSAASYYNLKHHASVSVTAFQQVNVDPFFVLFMKNTTDITRLYDDWFTVRIADTSFKKDLMSEGLSIDAILARKLHEVLSTGLGKRAFLVDIKHAPKHRFHTLSNVPTYNTSHLTVGLLLNPEQIDRTVDRGPPADDDLVAQGFRNFWGDKSELRRFQDSSILESVLWKESAVGGAIHRQIVEYVCQRHLNLGVRFEGFLQPGLQNVLDYAIDASERFNAAWRAFDSLYAILKDMDDLPLKVRQLTPAGMHVSNTANHTVRDVLELSLQFEGSSNWPEELKAIQFTKIAILSKLVEAVKLKPSYHRSRLRIDKNATDTVNCVFVEIICPHTDVLLRVQVHYERELDLLSYELRKSHSALERHTYSQAIITYKTIALHGPAHVQAIRRLSLHMPYLLPSVMLFRKWCSSHLLTAHLSIQLMELLVVHVFTAPCPYKAPSNAVVALLRVLDMIVEWNWRENPLIVNVSGEMTASQVSEASTHFEAWRKLDPLLNRTTLFVASCIDPSGAIFAHRGPRRVVLARLTALARASQTKMAASPADVSSIFSTGYADFDFVINLKDFESDNGVGVDKATFKNLTTPDMNGSSEALLQRRAFIEEIEDLYKDAIVFFHDWAERPVIAGLWIPAIDDGKWKIGLDYSSEPFSGTDRVKANHDAMLNDILRLGSDMIREVRLKR